MDPLIDAKERTWEQVLQCMASFGKRYHIYPAEVPLQPGDQESLSVVLRTKCFTPMALLTSLQEEQSVLDDRCTVTTYTKYEYTCSVHRAQGDLHYIIQDFLLRIVFPPCHLEVSAYQDALLGQIEQGLFHSPQLLVFLSDRSYGENTGLILACSDRLMVYTPFSRILMIVSSVPSKIKMASMYQSWVSYENYRSLAQQYPFELSLTQGKGAISVSIVTVKDASQAMDSSLRDTFDVLMVVDCKPTPSLTAVIDHYRVSYRIVFAPTKIAQTWSALHPSYTSMRE